MVQKALVTGLPGSLRRKNKKHRRMLGRHSISLPKASWPGRSFLFASSTAAPPAATAQQSAKKKHAEMCLVGGASIESHLADGSGGFLLSQGQMGGADGEWPYEPLGSK
jgi:hypothetical protein